MLLLFQVASLQLYITQRDAPSNVLVAPSGRNNCTSYYLHITYNIKKVGDMSENISPTLICLIKNQSLVG